MNKWRKVQLEDVSEYSNEKIDIGKINISNYVSTENLLPNIGGKNLSSGLPSKGKVTKYCKGDILISNIRPYFKKIWQADNVGGTSNDILVLKTKSDITSQFLYYNLACSDFFNYVMSGAKGTKMPRGDKNHILGYQINLPPIQEQKAIAHILSTLDDKIEVNNQINKTLENMAQAIFKQWFVDFEFPNKDGEPYKSSGGEMVESELGMIPKGWAVGTLNDIGEIIGGGTPSKSKIHYFAENGIPWITPKDLSNNKNKFIDKGALDISEEGLKNSSAKLMPEGSVLFSSRAPIGYIAIAKNQLTTNQGFRSIVPKELYGPEFVYQLLVSNLEKIESRASGSTFKEISGGELKKIEVVVPDAKVINDFNNIVTNMSNLIAINEDSNNYLINIRDSLLPKVMSGEIRLLLDEEGEAS